MALSRRLSFSIARGWNALRPSPFLLSTLRVNHLTSAARKEALVSTIPPHLMGTLRRSFTATAASGNKVSMTFLEDDGTETKVEAEIGATLLEVAHENDVDLEVLSLSEVTKLRTDVVHLRESAGKGQQKSTRCLRGELACSTCHVVLPKEYYDKLDEKDEEEDDMLDLAWGLTDTSRLGCQIKVTPELEGMLIKVPEDSMDQS